MQAPPESFPRARQRENEQPIGFFNILLPIPCAKHPEILPSFWR